MLISSLEQMEKIVSRNRNLRWDGWDVVFSYESDKGRTSKFGARVKGVWHLERRIDLTKNGWDMPKKYVR